MLIILTLELTEQWGVHISLGTSDICLKFNDLSIPCPAFLQL